MQTFFSHGLNGFKGRGARNCTTNVPHPFNPWLKNFVFAALLCVFVSSWLLAGTSDVADAAMSKNASAVRALIQQKANVNAAQADGTTAQHLLSAKSMRAPQTHFCS